MKSKRPEQQAKCFGNIASGCIQNDTEQTRIARKQIQPARGARFPSCTREQAQSMRIACDLDPSSRAGEITTRLKKFSLQITSYKQSKQFYQRTQMILIKYMLVAITRRNIISENCKLRHLSQWVLDLKFSLRNNKITVLYERLNRAI